MKTFYIPIFIELFCKKFVLSSVYFNAMKVAPNKFYNNNGFENWNLDSISLHIFCIPGTSSSDEMASMM